MQTQDHKKIISSGTETHGVHLCHKCGWPFPNPHPSARHRRAHKRVCGTVEGYKIGSSGVTKTQLDGSDDDHLSDDDRKNPSMEVLEKAPSVIISGVGSRSSRSTRSEEDVFSDAVADFAHAPATVVDAGDLYPVTSDNGTQVLDVECSRPEMERTETDMLSAHHSSSTSVGANVLQSEVAVVLASEEKQSVDVTVEKKSEDDSTKTLEPVIMPQKVNGDKDDCSPEVNFVGQISSSETGIVEGIAIILADNAGNISEAVSIPQKVKGDNLEFIHANATMEVKGRQGEGFDADNDCFPEADFAGQIKSTEQGSNIEAVSGSHLETFNDSIHLKERSEGILEDYEDHETENVTDAVTLDRAKEVECLAEPSESPNISSEDIISETIHQEDDFAEEVSKDKRVERTETHATDAEICGSSSEVVHPDKDDNEVGQGKMVTSPKERGSVILADDNLQGVLNESGNLVHSIEGVKPVHEDSERAEKDVRIFDALGADSTNVTVQQMPLTSDSGDYDVRSIEVEEKLSGSTPIVAQSDERVDGEVEVRKDDEHDANVTEQTHNEENCAHNASDSVHVNLFNNVINNGNHQDENEISKDAKELEGFGEECLGKVDLGLISDNDGAVDLTQTAANKSVTGVHVEAVSATEDLLSKENDGNGFDSANGDGNLVKQEEAVLEPDVQVDSVSQTDSLEGNWGSVSVLSGFSDAPASLQPKSNDGKSDIFKPPYITASPEQKRDNASESQTLRPVTPEANASSSSSGCKKSEEIIAKVTNWSTETGKQHMPLKSFLGESSPIAKGNRAVESQEAKKTITDTEEAAEEAARVEWNSSATYPASIKRDKGKVRSKPIWAPFICCSSVQTS